MLEASMKTWLGRYKLGLKGINRLVERRQGLDMVRQEDVQGES